MKPQHLFTISLISLIILSVFFFSVPVFAQDDEKPGANQQEIKVDENTQQEKNDAGQPEKKPGEPSDDTKSKDGKKPFQKETVTVSAGGTRIPLTIYRDEMGNILIPIKNVDTGRLMKKFDARITWLVPMKTVVLGLPGGKDFRIKIGEDTGLFGREKVKLKAKVKMIKGTPCIPLECMGIAYRRDISLNEVTHILYMDPIIEDVSFKEEKGKLRLVAQGTGPLQFKTSMLTEPDRYVVDIDHAVLDPKMEGKYIRYKYVGSIFVSQDFRMPNRVRIIIPIKHRVEIEMEEKPKDKNQVIAKLFYPEVVAPVQGLKVERVTRFKFKEGPDSVTFNMSTTGPVQYEWRRLLPPDNRYFIDIPKTLYSKKSFEKKLKAGYISAIKVEQIKMKPEPVVRVTLNLEVPSVVRVEPDPKFPHIIKIEILKKTINPRFVQRQGFGVTSLPVRGGIVICIDPGHGGGDPGACNSSYGLQEKHLTLDISMRLANMLRKAGWNVVMTRTTDRDVSFAGSSDARELGDRANIANSCRAQIFLSIHINASVSSSLGGTSTHCCKDIDYPLAHSIQQHLVSANGRRDIGVRTDRFFVVNHTNMPAALVECAFISNPSEASLLATSSFRQKCAEGIYNGLMAYAKSRNLGRPMDLEEEKDYTKERKIVKDKKAKIEAKIEKNESESDPDFGER